METPSPAVPIPDEPAPLSYAGTDTGEPLRPPFRTVSLRVALICWALPLAVGTLDFAVFLLGNRFGVGRSEAPVMIGLWNIAIGIALSFVGGICILVFAAQRWAPTVGHRWPDLFRPALIAALMLGSNYVVAYGIVYAVVQFMH